jgi:tetratricopeptide (TPR) repeat protein
VFAGGWSLDASEAVCSDGSLPVEGILDLLARLVDKSFVIVSDGQGATRYGMLETIREYSAERLHDAGGSEGLRRRHLAHFVTLAESADIAVGGTQEPDTLKRLAEDHDNFTAALDTASQHDHEALLHLAGCLAWFWSSAGLIREGRRWLQAALDTNTGPTRRRAHGLNGLAWLAWQQRDYSTAATLLGEAIAIFDVLGDDLAAARGYNNLGAVAHSQGAPAIAIAHYEAALAVYRRHGKVRDMAISLSNLGLWKTEAGMLEDGRRELDEALELVRQLDDDMLWPQCLVNCGINAIYRNDPDSARAFYTQSLTRARQLSDSISLVLSLDGFALLAAVQGDAPTAVRLTAAVTGLRQRLQSPPSPASERRYERLIAPVGAALNPGVHAAIWQDGLAMTVEQAIAQALGPGHADQ